MANFLVKFKDVDELFDNIENTQIFEWVNYLAEILPRYTKLEEAEQKRQGYHKVYQERKKLVLKEMKRLLDPDELERLKKLAEERVAEKEDE